MYLKLYFKREKPFYVLQIIFQEHKRPVTTKNKNNNKNNNNNNNKVVYRTRALRARGLKSGFFQTVVGSLYLLSFESHFIFLFEDVYGRCLARTRSTPLCGRLLLNFQLFSFCDNFFILKDNWNWIFFPESCYLP